MRVVMYVQNDVTGDSRVRREAGSLAAAGHDVTIMATPLADAANYGTSVADVPGVAVIRVPIPAGSRWWVTAIRAPWRLPVLAVVVVLPWVVIRGVWVGIVNRLFHRPVVAGGIDFIRRWRVEWLGWCRAAVAAAPEAEIHHAHDFEALPAAAAAARRDGSRYVYDSHEIYLEWGPVLRQPRYVRWIVGRWEARLARAAAAVITIGPALADLLRTGLGLSEVVVVRNCPPRWHPPGLPEDRIRTALSLASGTQIVLCHGGLTADRGLEQTALALLEPGLSATHLVMLGRRTAFIEPILADPRLRGRVHHLPPVAPIDVTPWVAGADVDVMAIQPSDLNNRLSTPNKLFESLSAGVPVVSSDFPARREIILDPLIGPLGALCDPTDPQSIAAALLQILDLAPTDRVAMRARILAAAHEFWNWETESGRLTDLYTRLDAASRP